MSVGHRIVGVLREARAKRSSCCGSLTPLTMALSSPETGPSIKKLRLLLFNNHPEGH